MRSFLIILMLSPISSLALDPTDQQRAEIEARIKPFTMVCVQGEPCSGVSAAVIVARSGKAVYETACMACHNAGIGGAPRVGDIEAWANRISKGIEALYYSGINGVAGTGMVARGACIDCSDDEIMAAVDFMVDGSR